MIGEYCSRPVHAEGFAARAEHAIVRLRLQRYTGRNAFYAQAMQQRPST